MKSESILLVLLTAACVASSNNQSILRNGSSNSIIDEIDDFVPYQGERFTTFDWKLLQTLSKSNHGNLLVSPLTLKLALILLYEGAQDETAHELANAIHLPVGRSATRDKFSSILQSLQEEKRDNIVNVGNRIFMDKSFLPRQHYGAIVKRFYNTDIINTNFNETSASAEFINNYVNNVTRGHIGKLIDDESRLKHSAMLIVSAMYFQGSWFRQPFTANQTRIDKFYVDHGKASVAVPYMRANNKFYFVYASDLDAKILRLPYAGHKYAMFIVLPQTPGRLDEVLKQITPYTINKHVWLMQEVPVDVMIPKFKFDFTSHLENVLRELGIRDIFDDTATLTGILRSKSTSRRLVVTDIIQKAGIEVNERGTVAYTATNIEIGNKINDETFHANHPFLFYIEDESSGAFLYMGVVNNPLEETGMDEATVPALQPSAPMDPPPRLDVPVIGTGVEERQNFFNIELLQTLNEESADNVIIGSTSIKSALMVLAEAAAGNSREQIVSALRLPSELVDIRRLASNTITSFKDQKSGTELQTAIKLWLRKDILVQQGFNEVVQRCYKGEVQLVNFNDAAGTAQTINDWVKQSTHGRINSITDQNSIVADTKVMLTTAVYFKGTWQKAFDKKDTKSRCFNVPKIGCQKVPLMENVAMYKYANIPALDAKVVEIPYTGGRITMLVILPQRYESQALKDISRNLAFMPMSVILASLREREILLQIPRFSIKNKIKLQESLQQLGIRDVFDRNANFTSAFPQSNVVVSSVTHHAQIEVSEEGTVAAAATEISVIPLMGSSITTFRADRPFIFFLLDKQTNGILFAGRYIKPDAATPPIPTA